MDLERFHPEHRSPLLHRRLAPGGEVVVGYVGRLAREKQLQHLAHLRGIPGVRVVVVGDGPARVSLERALPDVTFLGLLTGAALSQAVATLDVFVHTGIDETFCQSIQEALASGVPVVAPASGGPLDLVSHGGNGWAVPPNKPSCSEGRSRPWPGRGAAPVHGRPGPSSVAARTWGTLGDELLGQYQRVTGMALGGRGRGAA